MQTLYLRFRALRAISLRRGLSYRYDQVRDPLDGQMKYRCLYEKDGADVPSVLVNDPDVGDGRVILFDNKSGSNLTRSTRR